MYDKVIGDMVPLDTDILLVDEADIVVGEGDLVQMEAEQEDHNDEEEYNSPLLHKSHPKPLNSCSSIEIPKQDWTPFHMSCRL